MGINTKGMFRGLGNGIADWGGVLMQEAVAQKREARLAQYRQAERTDERAYQDDVRREGYVVEGIQQERSAAAAAAAAQRERMNELTDAATEREHDMTLAEHKAGLKQPDTVVTVNNNPANTDARQEEFMKEVGKADAAMYTATRDAAVAASAVEDSLHVMEEISKEFETGKTQQAMARLGQWLGTDAGSAMQAWEGTAAPLILARTKEMAGVLSDTDMKIIISSVPSFGNSNEANRIVTGILRKAVERTRENERSMQAHMEKYGSLNNWQAPNRQGEMSREAQQNVDAATDPLNAINPDLDGFNSFRSNR